MWNGGRKGWFCPQPGGSKPSPPHLPNLRLCRAPTSPDTVPSLRHKDSAPATISSCSCISNFSFLPESSRHMQTSFKKTKRKQKKSPLITCYISLLPLKIALQKNRPSVPPRPRPGAPRTHVRELPSSGWPASCFSPSPASQSPLVSLSVLVTRVCVPCVSATPSRLSGLLSSSPPSP